MESHPEKWMTFALRKGEKIMNKNDLTIFDFEGSDVRTMVIDGEPWFIGKDVAEILGYKNQRDALRKHVDEEDKDVAKCDSLGGQQDMAIINESGLYSLILSSKLPAAKRFKHWVTSDVLPKIRKHGAYATPEVINQIISNPDFGIKLLQTLKEEQEKCKALEQTVAVQETQIIEMQPKASYYDIVLNCKDLIPISVIAKDFGVSGRWMNKYLHDKGIQYKQGDIWLPYAKYASQGYTSTKTHTYGDGAGRKHAKIATYWTQAGRLFIYETMKSDGHLPLIEQQNQD